ncbi:synaptophysin-like protein 1 isoform X2 [Symphalangus syndactylus]|uniref:synaptophysin-like protein 1 isoform X2 n=1 Tax=Symphalangus syndactylus TaxID=9590 RepID=UPI002443585B|nr:synaptophysin-like protein 1 isoform X1 [Symphalangus syndactylus]
MPGAEPQGRWRGARSMAPNIYMVRQRISRLGQRMSGFQINLNPLKEPLGFIKVLEWSLGGVGEYTRHCGLPSNFVAHYVFLQIASIFAFATCGGFKGQTEIQVNCPTTITENKTVTATFGYPFRLNEASFQPPPGVNICDVNWKDYVLIGDYSSSAQFYVTFAVFVFLYCIAALLLYVGYTSLYLDSRKLPMIDFVVTLVATFLWLVSTSAWAKALTDIKIATGHNIVNELSPCKKKAVMCYFGSVTSMGSLNVSVVFGFLNMILWGGNAWFVYKETSLHSPSNTSVPHSQGGIPPPTGI